MGLKLRLGLAGLGLALSSMFGVNMLAGVKDYVDTTGNIMVDIADGIGMVSKGIEALEYYLDPSSSDPAETTADKVDTPTPPPGGASTPQPPQAAPGEGNQPTVFCQKGKCYPYDPARMKNPNMNLEAKPGMILTAQTQPPKNLNNNNKRRRQSEDEDDEGKGKIAPGKNKARPAVIDEKSEANPDTKLTPQETPSPSSISEQQPQNSTGAVTHGTKRLLSSIKGLLERTSKVIVKLVHKIFPWNRRARRRVMGDGDDDEL